MFRVGVVGAGRLARTHIRHLRRVSEVAVTVYDSNFEFAQTMASEVGGIAVQSLTELIDLSEAVLVVTPNFAHAEASVAVINAKKHLFVEKPLSVSTATAKPILDAALSSESVVLVGHVLRHFAMFKAAHDFVAKGGIGTPSAIRMSRGGKMPGGAGSWFNDHSKSGGVFIDLGIHDFDWLLWTLGDATQISARSVGVVEGSGADYGLATVTFSNGAVGHVESTWMDEHDPYVAFEVCGSEGMIEYDSRRSNTLKSGSWSAQNFLSDDDPFYLQMKNFYESCKGTANPNVSIREAYTALELAETALRSARTGEPIQI